MRRWISFLMAFGVLSLGVTASASGRDPGAVTVPALQGTVRDQCSGKILSSQFVVSLMDPTGAVVSPSKLTASAFEFQRLSEPSYVLQVSAPGYAALGDPAGPSPGVTISPEPGPVSDAVTGLPGRIVLPGGVEVFAELRVAVLLSPTGGCATPRRATIPALSGHVLDETSGARISGLTVALLNDAGADAFGPNGGTVGTGTFAVKTLPCGFYDLMVAAPGYNALGPDLFVVDDQSTAPTCDGTIGNGDIAYGTSLWVRLAAAQLNHPPVIDWISTLNGYAIKVGSDFPVQALVHDPDPPDNAALVSHWTEIGGFGGNPFCAFADPAALDTTMKCLSAGTGEVTFSVTDPHGATTSSSFMVIVKP
jgi:hypothetical protein